MWTCEDRGCELKVCSSSSSLRPLQSQWARLIYAAIPSSWPEVTLPDPASATGCFRPCGYTFLRGYRITSQVHGCHDWYPWIYNFEALILLLKQASSSTKNVSYLMTFALRPCFMKRTDWDYLSPRFPSPTPSGHECPSQTQDWYGVQERKALTISLLRTFIRYSLQLANHQFLLWRGRRPQNSAGG